MKKGGFIYGFTGYLRAFKAIISTPKLLKFSLLPIFINIVVLCLVLYFGFDLYEVLMQYLLPDRTAWWQLFLYWLSWIIFPVIFLVLLFYVFISVAAVIASPFLEILSSKYLTLLNPESLRKSQAPFLKIMMEELKKIVALLIVATIAFPLNFIPVAGSILYFLAGAMLFAFEFLDYPMCVSEWPFKKRYSFVFKNILTTAGLGIAITISFIIPVIGFFCLPVSTVAATRIFHDLKGPGNEH